MTGHLAIVQSYNGFLQPNFEVLISADTDHMIAFWALGNQFIFIAIWIIPWSPENIFLHFLLVPRIYSQFLAKNYHWIKWIHLTATLKKVVKSGKAS